MLASPQNCQDFRDLPSRNPQTKEDFDLTNNRAQFDFYKNNCLPPLTTQEIINKYDDKFCAAFFSSIDNSGNFIEPWSGMQNPTGGFETVSKICGFREPEQRNFTLNTQINCNTGGINDCISFQPVNNRMEIGAWLDAQHRYIENLHDDDRRLITAYESMDSFRWNNVLRGIGKPCDRQNNETPDQFSEKFQRFYNLILRAPKTPRMYAYRGIRVNQFDFFNKDQDDKIVERKGFTSLSININASAFYAFYINTGNVLNPWVFDPNLNNGQINVLEIPLGTPALFVSSRAGNQIEAKYELVLLPHTVKFVSVDTSISIPLVMNHNNPLNLTRIYKYKYMSSIPLNTYFPKGIDTIPSESIINDFITYCKNYSGANQFFAGGILYPSVIKGGFGINKLLNHRYKAINLNPTGDLDIEVYSNNLVSFNTKIVEIQNLLNNFVGSIQTRFPAFNPVNRLNVQNRTLVANSKILLSLQFTPCDDKRDASNNRIIENIIDIKINLDNILFVRLTDPVTIPQILDIDLSNDQGIPIKNVTAYLEELKDLLRRTIVNGADPITRNSRNPYLPDINRRNKGKKTIERAKTLCSIDSRPRNNGNLREMCKILSRLSMREILPPPVSTNIADLNNAANQLEVRFGASLNP